MTELRGVPARFTDSVLRHGRRGRRILHPSQRHTLATLEHLRPPWHTEYRRAVMLTDLSILALALLTARLVRFGAQSDVTAPGTGITYTVLGFVIAVFWWVTLQVYGASDSRILGDGPEEYRRLVQASVTTFGLVAIATLIFKQDMSRGYLLIAFPVGVMGLVLGRKLLRSWLVRSRRGGAMCTNVLVVGGLRSARAIDSTFVRHPGAGLRLTGVWIPNCSDDDVPQGYDVPKRYVPVMGASSTLADALSRSEAGMVVVTDTEHLGNDGLKSLLWQLKGVDIDLMVSPNVMDVATPRVQVRSVGSTPFLHLEEPRYDGATRLSKTLFDRMFALGALVALSPVLITAALAIKLTSPGPVLYKSERIGVGGVAFNMLKFRSMVPDAETMVPDLLPDNDGAGPLFKLQDDPRVTKVGKFLRRFSIDELPQFINVLRGDMSVVGPRPPLRREVEQWDGEVHRRLLVKQGVTGLWQVSGRSDLSWEEAVRLDLDYVENWSMVRDIQIIWRTARAVLRHAGAY